MFCSSEHTLLYICIHVYSDYSRIHPATSNITDRLTLDKRHVRINYTPPPKKNNN